MMPVPRHLGSLTRRRPPLVAVVGVSTHTFLWIISWGVFSFFFSFLLKFFSFNFSFEFSLEYFSSLFFFVFFFFGILLVSVFGAASAGPHSACTHFCLLLRLRSIDVVASLHESPVVLHGTTTVCWWPSEHRCLLVAVAGTSVRTLCGAILPSAGLSAPTTERSMLIFCLIELHTLPVYLRLVFHVLNQRRQPQMDT